MALVPVLGITKKGTLTIRVKFPGCELWLDTCSAYYKDQKLLFGKVAKQKQ